MASSRTYTVHPNRLIHPAVMRVERGSLRIGWDLRDIQRVDGLTWFEASIPLGSTSYPTFEYVRRADVKDITVKEDRLGVRGSKDSSIENELDLVRRMNVITVGVREDEALISVIYYLIFGSLYEDVKENKVDVGARYEIFAEIQYVIQVSTAYARSLNTFEGGRNLAWADKRSHAVAGLVNALTHTGSAPKKAPLCKYHVEWLPGYVQDVEFVASGSSFLGYVGYNREAMDTLRVEERVPEDVWSVESETEALLVVGSGWDVQGLYVNRNDVSYNVGLLLIDVLLRQQQFVKQGITGVGLIEGKLLGLWDLPF